MEKTIEIKTKTYGGKLRNVLVDRSGYMLLLALINWYSRTYPDFPSQIK